MLVSCSEGPVRFPSRPRIFFSSQYILIVLALRRCPLPLSTLRYEAGYSTYRVNQCCRVIAILSGGQGAQSRTPFTLALAFTRQASRSCLADMELASSPSRLLHRRAENESHCLFCWKAHSMRHKFHSMDPIACSCDVDHRLHDMESCVSSCWS